MLTIFAAMIAVTGTLGGTLTAGLLQQRQTKRTADIANRERLRQERLDAYITFAKAIASLRGTQIQRLLAQRDYGRENTQHSQAREAQYQARTDARGALVRIQLLTDDEEVVRLAKEAMAVTIAVADGHDGIQKRADRSREATDAFVQAAAQRGQVR